MEESLLVDGGGGIEISGILYGYEARQTEQPKQEAQGC